jgi:trigger factor
MQVSVETTQGLQRRMTVQVPSERVDKEVESRLRNLSGRVRLDGFRPGKVPFKVLRQRFGDQVRSEVLGEVLQSSYSEAVGQEKLRPAGTPEIEAKQMEAGKDLEYVATFEVLPEFEVQGVEGMSLERPVSTIGDAEVDDVIENLRKQSTDYEAVERAAAGDDKVVVDFEGEIDGKPFTGNQGEDVPVIIGSGQMPSEFEQALVGVKAGDKKDVEYAFPEHFPDKEVAGKTAVFHVAVKSVEAPQLPAVDDAFAEKVGIKEGGVEALRGKIKESLERQRDQAVRGHLKQQVMSKLIEANPIEVPQALVDGEIDYLRNQAKARMSQMGQQGAEPELPSSLFEEEARRRVALGLVINELIRKQGIKLDQAKLRQALQDIAAGYDQPQQVIQYYAQNRKLMEGVEVAVLEDQVVDWVVESAAVTDKPTSFKALVGGEAAAEENEG